MENFTPKIDYKSEEADNEGIFKKLKFSIVIPAYNEETRIKPVIEEICKYIDDNDLQWELVISIDGNDGTECLVKNMAKEYNFLKYIKGTGRSGKGSAIKRAMNVVNSDYVLLMDADGAISFGDILKFLNLSDEYDVVNFERYTKKSNCIPGLRRVVSRGYNFYIRILLGIHIKDTQCGYKIMKAPLAKQIFNKLTITDGFFYAPMFYYLKKMKSKIIEVPIRYSHDEGSKFNVSSMILGGFVSALAFRLRYSRIWKYIPDKLIEIYYKKFRWM